MATKLLPAIDSSGQWKLLAPFDTQLFSGLAYTCKSIRKFSEAIGAGVEIYAEYYEPNNIGEDVYQQHVNEDAALITLVSSSGTPLLVPSPYLDGWPSSNVVPYVVLGMVVTLGALPNTIDPGFLQAKVENVIKSSLGHQPDVQFVALSEVSNVEFSQHEQLENLRKANISDDNTDYVRRVKAEDDLVKARAEIAALQKFIIDSGISVPVVDA